MLDSEFYEVLGILKSYVKKKIAALNIPTVTVTQTITEGEELADIDINGDSTKLFMPAVKINGQAQEVTENEIDLEVANHTITSSQWDQITSIYT